MGVIFDFVLIILSTIIMYHSYKRIIFNKKSSIANIIILVVYIFNILPILLNYLIGIPEYNTVYWYKPFIEPMKNEIISIIYDTYILLSFLLLNRHARKNNAIDNNIASSYQVIFNNNVFCTIAILSPLIMILLTGTVRNYFVFNISSARGLSKSSSALLLTPLLLLSVFTFFSKFYNNKKITPLKIVLSFVYFFFIVWLSGKRFMIANLCLLLIFYVSKSDIKDKTRNKLEKIIPVLFISLLGFSVFYLTVVRPLKDTSFISVYDMLRVDFGRDDVVKYVINEEFLKHNQILDYRFQSIISLLLFFIPRNIWPTKPYPHYMYLTGHLLGLSIHNLPAGTTPSWYEMCLCNFGYIGFLIAIISLPLLCKIADNSKSLDSKALWLMLIIVLLTQSMDVYAIYIFIIFAIFSINLFFKGKKVKFVVK